MIITYEQLLSTLNITTETASEVKYDCLKQWCFKNISKDVYSRNIDDYEDLARHYLEFFLSNIPEHETDVVRAFNNMSVLQYAADKGYDRYIQLMDGLEEHVINFQTPTGMTSLHLAASRGHLHAVIVLLAQGASPHKMNMSQEFPIQSALFTPMMMDEDEKNRKTAIFNRLKSSAPDTITAIDSRGNNLAHKIASHGYDALMPSMINEHQSLVLSHNNFNKYPIHMAILNGQVEIVKQLLPVAGVIDLEDADGHVALHYAAEQELPEIIQNCCPYYPQVDVLDRTHKTPLMCAAEFGNIGALITLLEHKADVHLKDNLGFSPLHYAVNSGNIEVVSYLLENSSININTKDIDNKSALFYANQQGNNEIAQLLINKGAEFSSCSP